MKKPFAIYVCEHGKVFLSCAVLLTAFLSALTVSGMGAKPQIDETTRKNTSLKGVDVKTNTLGMFFIYIAPGTYMMGSNPDEQDRGENENRHRVSISKGFYIQATEVTQGQWKKVMNTNPSYFRNGGDDCPVEMVSWNEAQVFIKKLNKKERHNKYRLPTEAEWEFACRSGTATPFYSGHCLTTDQANYDGNNPAIGCSFGSFKKKTMQVASFLPNPWALYDMHGNVWEWCEDRCAEDGAITDGSFRDGAVNPLSKGGDHRVVRGGSWISDASYCRSSSRENYRPDYRGYNIGFRLCREM